MRRIRLQFRTPRVSGGRSILYAIAGNRAKRGAGDGAEDPAAANRASLIVAVWQNLMRRIRFHRCSFLPLSSVMLGAIGLLAGSLLCLVGARGILCLRVAGFLLLFSRLAAFGRSSMPGRIEYEELVARALRLLLFVPEVVIEPPREFQGEGPEELERRLKMVRPLIADGAVFLGSPGLAPWVPEAWSSWPSILMCGRLG